MSYVLRSQRTSKQYNIAKFRQSPFPQSNQSSTQSSSFKLYHKQQSTSKQASKQQNSIANSGGGKQPSPNQTGKKQGALSKKEQDSIRGNPWNLEESDGKNAYVGSLEGGQSSAYVLFVMQGNEFRVYHVNDWHNFRPKMDYAMLTLEEAEQQLALRKKLGEKVADRYGKALIKKEADESTKDDSFIDDELLKKELDEELNEENDGDDEREKNRTRRDQSAKSKRGGDGEGDEGGDEAHEDMDFEETFDDDDVALEPENAPPEEVPPPEEDKHESEGEEDEQGEESEESALTKSGQEMKNLLRRNVRQAEGGGPEEGAASGDESDSSVDDDFNPEEDTFPSVLLPSKTEASATSSSSTPSSSQQSSTSSAKDAGAASASKAPAPARSVTPSLPSKSRPVNGGTESPTLDKPAPATASTRAPSDSSKKNKRSTPDTPNPPTGSSSVPQPKKIKVEPSTPASSAPEMVPLTEESVRQELIKRGPLRTKDLIEIFKPTMSVDKSQLNSMKTLFAEIVKKLTIIKKDSAGENRLHLK
mmetsp:Transcript_43507/g.70590  ORF Transcript_43507/g.70590 Transcript_43507/m.70590 type:complete len:533 (+) Transcript_43507:22-1620(+)